ncbi:MAG: sulfatase-like hydrolase/transferase [Gammaproteobacteria bacterium]|nr:sulfatase-like hydrolase/transferase [Gammaproteobacteria bacterium]
MIDYANPLKTGPRSGLFSYLVMLTAIFCVLEISFFIQCSGFYLADYKMVMSHLTIPFAIFPGILFFLFAQCLVHAGFVLIVWLMARLIGYTLGSSWKTTQNLGFSLWCIGLAFILLANEYFFPNSKFADLMRLMISPRVALILLSISSCILVAALMLAVLGLLSLLMKKFHKLAVFLLGASIVAGLAGFSDHAKKVVVDGATADKPNIILIGVDALRPDFLGYFGAATPTPHFDEFLDQSTVFAEAITPIARTFPAWVSIFTGKYPKETNARFDLADQTHLDLTETLPLILHKQGYETIYAMDETRFSNIGKNFGFDQIVTPPVGVNDFLLGTFNDFPLSNLVINTAIGQWLFPNSYANRPAFVSYDPDSFLKMLTPALSKQRNKPLFLAVHFCLPHFPYFWRDYSYLETERALAHYAASIQRADQQVADFLVLLQQQGLLKHSIVVLLSDHGETLELHGDRITNRDRFIAGADNPKHIIPKFYPASFDFEKVNQSAGHGTDVLGMPQYHAVMAFRLYGLAPNQKNAIPGIVSLMDIKPTILSLLNIPFGNVSGSSLKEVVLGKERVVSRQNDFFIESDFSPSSIRSVHPETRQILFEGISFFQIDPVTTHLTVKQSMADLILSSKQYADIYGSWILALYPQANGVMSPILVDLKTGLWTNDLTTSFALHSPALHMLSALKAFYGNEIGKISSHYNQSKQG